MKICIAGGTGFLGQALKSFWEKKGYTVSVLTRNPKKENEVHWDGETIGPWISEIETAEVLLNMSGKSVDCRYNEANKRAILDSRINSTLVLHEAITKVKRKPKLWINASSATIYVHSEVRLNNEVNGVIGDDFSMNICKQWEKHFYSRTLETTRQVTARTSIVLGKSGGAFAKVKQITRLGLGGYQGSGNQKMSWIHIEDFCRALDYIIENEELEGPVNVTAPIPTNNRNFMRAVRKKVGIPFGLPQPKWLLEIGALLIRTEAELLLKSRNVFPKLLSDAGFRFNYSDVDSAVAAI